MERSDAQSDLLSQIVDLHRLASALHSRIHEDVLALGRVHQDMALALGHLCTEGRPTAVSSTLTEQHRVMRIAELAKRIGLGRSTIWNMIKREEFPMPLRLGTRAVGWLEADVIEWLKGR